MSNVFFTSDPHWFHRLITRLRGFGEGEAAVQAHNAALMEAWCDTISADDIVWVLGDLTCSDGAVPNMLNIMRSLPGRKRLVWGNHDPGHPMHSDAMKWQKKYLEVFEYVTPFATVKVPVRENEKRQKVLLSHFPYTLDHTHDARFEQWRLRDEGEYLLHGHTHSSIKVSSRRELHVGADAWAMKPVSLSTVAKFLRGESVE